MLKVDAEARRRLWRLKMLRNFGKKEYFVTDHKAAELYSISVLEIRQWIENNELEGKPNPFSPGEYIVPQELLEHFIEEKKTKDQS